MAKYILALIGLGVIGIVLSTKEGRFDYVQTELNTQVTLKDESATVLFVGDIMLGRNLEVLGKKYGNDYAFRSISSELTKVDAVVANLEGPIMSPHILTPSGSVRFSFSSTTPALLKKNNITIVSLANNHTVDYGSDGYTQTTQYLDSAQILHVGHPFAFSDQYIIRKEIAGKKFVFVAFNFTNPNFDTESAIQYIKNLSIMPEEYLVGMIHGGDEYKLVSNTMQKTFYRKLIDTGVDAVIAHHPHVTQEIELYKNKPIFYSLGNFIFDQYFSKDVEEGIVVTLTLDDTDARYEIRPIKGNHSQPKLMNEEEKNVFLQNLAVRSPSIQESVKKGELIIAR